MDILRHTLNNGIRLVHHRIPGIVAHCGLLINAGSRDETADEHGMAHFIEHMLFKGTRKRKSYHILTRLEDAGGELNAYTTKEETAIHASFLKDDYDRAMELISDIVFNSVFPAKEIEKEKDVIIEEINSYHDNPGELIFDEFEEVIFPGQAIGRSILGTGASVKAIGRSGIDNFIARNYNPGQMVFCSVGNIDNDKLVRLFNRYFGHISPDSAVKRNNQSWEYCKTEISKKMDTYQNHCIIGNRAFNLHDDRRLGMFMLNNIIGGQGSNSRLNMSLREKHGLAYNVESGYNPYYDTGVFYIYFGTDSKYLAKSIAITHSEMAKLRSTKLGSIQMGKARNQIKGYLARGFENHESLMLSLGKSILAFDKVDTIEDICKKIDAINSSDLLEIANAVFDPGELSTLIYT